MRALFPALALATLAGCAVQPPITVDEIRARAPGATDYQLCRATILDRGAWAQVAGEEQRRRGLDCAPYAQAIIADETARRQMVQQSIQQATQPSTYQIVQPAPSTTVHCISDRIGSQVETRCR